MKCFDVSENNSFVDWDAAVAEGYKACIVRIGYGQGHEDSKFREYAQAALDHGLKLSGYWFSYALNADQAKQEGEYCRQIIDDWNGPLDMIWFDQESSDWRDKNGCDYSSLTQQVIEFANALELNCGFYSYYSWCTDGHVDAEYLRDECGLPFWLAAYNNDEEPCMDCKMWQYTRTGTIGGMSPVDLNVMGE